MTSRVRCSALAVAISSMVLASSAVAQVKVEMGATIGLYAPLGSFQPAGAYSSNLPHSPSSLGGTAVGGQLRLWVAPRIGFELAGSTASSSVGGASTPNPYRSDAPEPARVSTGTAQLLFRLTRDESRARVWIGAGAGVVQHGGDAYTAFSKPVNYGGVLGLGSAIRIRGGLSADLGLTSMIYNFDIRGITATDPGLSERGKQLDLLLHTGLSYSWH